ncbi:TonB-dependent siderophore receptor [Paracoccus liaowanqingii]|uniref:TonB-dependent siderophore receptor n=1 Tax=Paracoccus liaowanqingii TaxID=2560053 RepID=A0A4Z1CLB7_9RHOB|nr:TonB-dependent siderophore receptor [Paracoccus liaowanqingii]TGN58163.1 TonB-dependent siderophore receptor [Paracoccus liaowanqingii]
MSASFRSTCLAGASILALSATAALSQDAPEPILLDEIVLTATTDTSAQADGYVAGYGQVATKSDTPLAETQQSISVVTGQQIEDQHAQTLGQALNYTAGVLGEPFGADPRFDSPTVRGFEARGSQYVNGLRQLRYMGAPAFETYGVQQVEVLKGPNSSLYGAGSPSGIINQVQKRAQATDVTELGTGYDSNDSGQLFFDVNRAPSDVLSWRLTGIARDSQTQIDELTNQRGYLGAALRYAPNALTTVDLIASYTKDAPISPPGVPFALTGIADGKDLRDDYYGEPSFDDSDREMANVGIEISHELDNGWTLSQGFRVERFDWDYTGHYVNRLTEDGLSVTRGANRQQESTSGLNLDTRLSNRITTGAVTHDLLVGLDIRQYDADTTTEFFFGQPLDWRAPDFGALPLQPAWYVSRSDVTLKQIGIYVQDEISVGNWRGSLALRQDWTEQTGTEVTTGETTLDQSDDALTGRAGLSYVMANGVMPYVSYSTSFDPEIGLDDTTGETLEPTTGKQWELGVKYQPTTFDALFTAAIYDLTQENLVRNLGAGVNRQVGEITSRGLELEATAELTEGWAVRAGYAYNRTEQVGGLEDGLEMPNAPRHLASLWVDRDFGNGIRAGGGLRHIGSRKGDFGNTFDLDSVTLVDLGASYTRGNVEASVNLANLTDEVYLANCGAFGCYYGEGRTLAAKVAYRW